MQINLDKTVSSIMQGIDTGIVEGERPPVIVATADETAERAERWFSRYDVHHLPVVESLKNPVLCGIVSTVDLVHYHSKHPNATLGDVPLSEVMVKEPEKIAPHTTLHDAFLILASASYQSLPVVDATGHCVGIVTTRDLVRFIAEQLGPSEAQAD